MEAAVHACKRQQLYSDGCKLDRQRQSLQADADVPDQDRIVLRENEIRLGCSSAVDEEHYGRRLSDKHAILGRRWRQGERGDRPLGLPTQVKRFTAGHQNLQCGTRREKVCDEPGGRDHLLEVVEHQRELPCLEIQLKGFDQWLVAGVANPKDLGNRSSYECWIA